jgi:ribosomal protein S14
MLSKQKKDKILRQKFCNRELLKIRLKFLFTYFLNKKSNLKRSCHMGDFFYGLSSKKNTKTKIVRRCVLNNRGRGSTRSFGIYRILFRELLKFEIIPRYSKAVW